MDDDRQVHIQYKGVSAVLLKHLIFCQGKISGGEVHVHVCLYQLLQYVF